MERDATMETMIRELYRLLASIDEPELMEQFFVDLCTRKELEQMAQRLEAAKLLNEGLTYTQVMEQTKISTTTLSRVSQALQYGEGYQKVLKK